MTDAELLERMNGVSVEDLLLPLLVQLAVILAAARVFAVLFRRIGQPAVVGEIAAGLVLGPSVLGALAPGAFAAVFRPGLPGLPPEASDLLLSRVLMALAQIGLVLLLFLVGLELDFSHLKWNGRSAFAVSLAGLCVPFALGAALGWWAHPYVGETVDRLSFVLFLGTALAITAIPVLGRIMLELGITRTRVAAITMASAAGEDACGWVLLAAVAAGARAAFDPVQTLAMLAATAAFAALMIFLARPILTRAARLAVRDGRGALGPNALSALLVALFVCAIVTNRIGVFAIFGAFLLGAVLSGEHAFRDAVNRRLGDLVTGFFLPIFFAYTGLRTDVGTLTGWQMWLIAGLVSVGAILGKVGGCGLAAWLTGFRPREAACIGVMMNTRGLMELIVINVGKDLGIIPESVYCMLVLMALVTTFMTTPLLLWLRHDTELEGPIERSGLVGKTTDDCGKGQQELRSSA